MKLSEVKNMFPDRVQIVKDSSFSFLGMATSRYDEYGVLSFLENVKYLDAILENKMISAVIISKDNLKKIENLGDKVGILVTEYPKKLFYDLHNVLVAKQFYLKKTKNIIHPMANISERAIIATNNVNIGANTIIEDNVIIYAGVSIGSNVIIRSGSIIGSNGFQFLNNGVEVIQVLSAGQVEIYDNVEIQHNCCVDRGVLGGKTILKESVKIDNFVHIAHDCQIGERTLITAGVKFGGRTVVGKDCWLGINATISNGLFIGDNVKVTLGSVVTRNVDSNMTVTGNFAIEHSKFINFLKTIR